MKATTINEVIEYLDQIIEDSKRESSYRGYFPALYRKVTIRVKEGIEKGEFEDGPRMERLDVLFANRYLDAYYRYKSDLPVTKSWAFAFEKTKNWWPLTLQHLLWGINAHINLDLGIAAVDTTGVTPISELKNDFDKINEVLAELVEEVQDELCEIWPFLKVLLKLSGKLDNKLINFSMKLARDGAWEFAEELAATSPQERSQAITKRDIRIEEIAEYVYPANILARILFGIIRVGLRKSVPKRIEILE
ncbi:DUF5995 family protein [Cryomorphaceae bacterium 1068]|nr:DUF5995 family protein [Cryomorphaceae bacterium 1068]